MKFLTLALFLFVSLNAFAKDVPSRAKPVTDTAGVLSRQVVEGLGQALHNVKKQTGNEISVLIVKSLDDESISSYSLKVADKWKLGSKEKDNGVLFLVAIDNRKMRIEVGQGLEGDLPDVVAGRIIRSVRPYFKKGDYKSGIIYGVSQIVQKTGGKLTGAPRSNRQRRSSGSGSIITIIIFIIFALLGGRGRRGGGGMMTGMMIGSMMGGRRSSFGGSSGFSGGGGFGGGGGFSGGGASGGW